MFLMSTQIELPLPFPSVSDSLSARVPVVPPSLLPPIFFRFLMIELIDPPLPAYTRQLEPQGLPVSHDTPFRLYPTAQVPGASRF